jgi:hypothetical protein
MTAERLRETHPPPGGGRISIIAAAERGEVLPMFKASALNVAAGAVTNKKGARAWSRADKVMTTTSRTFSHRCRAWSALAGLAGLFRTLAGGLGDHYRPELHYMRGPGPKWRAKHRSPL